MRLRSVGQFIFCALLSLWLSGCATLQSTAQRWYDFYSLKQPPVSPNYGSMTYLEILNYEMRQKYGKRPSRGSRYIIFYGKLSETEQGGGVKVIFRF